MADPTDEQGDFGGLGQALLGNIGISPALTDGLGPALIQGLSDLRPSPLAGRLIGYVPTFAPPALGDSVQPIGAPAPGNADDVSQAIGQSLTEAQRPDLGGWGLVRNLLPRGFSRDMFDNYMQGNGDYELSPERFQDIVNTADGIKNPKLLDVSGPDGEPLQRRTYNFGDAPDYKLSLGSASLFYDKSGKPAGFYDDYNFDPATNKRNDSHELETRAMYVARGLGLAPQAKPFKIKYGAFVPPT